MKARKELRFVAVALIVIAVFLLGVVGLLTPVYLGYRAMNWDRVFLSAKVYRELLVAFTLFLYGCLPGMALVLVCAGRTILKHYRKVPDNANVA